jgi:molybdopterin converting factor small subunit
MDVNVTLLSAFAKLRHNLDNGKATVKEGATVKELAMKIGLPLKYVRIVIVSGRQVDLDTVLTEGDRVLFLPPAIGGG